MRLFGIHNDGKFIEYVQIPFQLEHEEVVLENWLESNPDGIIEDEKILIIGRQVRTNFGGFIDLLGVDRYGTIVVIELKRDRTPHDTLAQALEYASFAERLDTEQLEGILRLYQKNDSVNLAEYHRGYFDLGTDEAVAFNKDQRIVVVGQAITPEIKQTAFFLRSKGIGVTCAEFSFFQANGETRLLSQEIVVGKEGDKPSTITSISGPVVTESGFMTSLDDNGRVVFSRILTYAKNNTMPINWGYKGFSLNVNLEGTRVAIIFGYPAASVFRQSVYTDIVSPDGMIKTAVPGDVIESLRAKAHSTGLFKPAGRELKCLIDRTFKEDEVSELISWINTVAEVIKQYGLKE